jgi:hypothetical protein
VRATIEEATVKDYVLHSDIGGEARMISPNFFFPTASSQKQQNTNNPAVSSNYTELLDGLNH